MNELMADLEVACSEGDYETAIFVLEQLEDHDFYYGLAVEMFAESFPESKND